MRLLLILKVKRLNGLQFHPLLGKNFLVDNNCANAGNLSKSESNVDKLYHFRDEKNLSFAARNFTQNLLTETLCLHI